MSRYSARIRQVEKMLGLGECAVCTNGRYPALDMVWINEDETEPEPTPPKMCPACGKPMRTTRVVWDLRAGALESQFPPSQQPATVSAVSPSSAAERVADQMVAQAKNSPPLDNNGHAESRSKPRVRRRQYSG